MVLEQVLAPLDRPTCQSGARLTMNLESGLKYAALADVPGISTRTFLALREPTLRMPTLLYCAGVPGAA